MRQLLSIFIAFLFFTSCSEDIIDIESETTEQSTEIRRSAARIVNFQHLQELVDSLSDKKVTTYDNDGKAIGWRYLTNRLIVNGEDEPVGEMSYDSTNGVRLSVRSYDGNGRLKRIIVIGEAFPHQSAKQLSKTLTLWVNIGGTSYFWENAPIHVHWCLDYADSSPDCGDEIGQVSSIAINP